MQSDAVHVATSDPREDGLDPSVTLGDLIVSYRPLPREDLLMMEAAAEAYRGVGKDNRSTFVDVNDLATVRARTLNAVLLTVDARARGQGYAHARAAEVAWMESYQLSEDEEDVFAPVEPEDDETLPKIDPVAPATPPREPTPEPEPEPPREPTPEPEPEPEPEVKKEEEEEEEEQMQVDTDAKDGVQQQQQQQAQVVGDGDGAPSVVPTLLPEWPDAPLAPPPPTAPPSSPALLTREELARLPPDVCASLVHAGTRPYDGSRDPARAYLSEHEERPILLPTDQCADDLDKSWAARRAASGWDIDEAADWDMLVPIRVQLTTNSFDRFTVPLNGASMSAAELAHRTAADWNLSQASETLMRSQIATQWESWRARVLSAHLCPEPARPDRRVEKLAPGVVPSPDELASMRARGVPLSSAGFPRFHGDALQPLDEEQPPSIAALRHTVADYHGDFDEEVVATSSLLGHRDASSDLRVITVCFPLPSGRAYFHDRFLWDIGASGRAAGSTAALAASIASDLGLPRHVATLLHYHIAAEVAREACHAPRARLDLPADCAVRTDVQRHGRWTPTIFDKADVPEHPPNLLPTNEQSDTPPSPQALPTRFLAPSGLSLLAKSGIFGAAGLKRPRGGVAARWGAASEAAASLAGQELQPTVDAGVGVKRKRLGPPVAARALDLVGRLADKFDAPRHLADASGSGPSLLHAVEAEAKKAAGAAAGGAAGDASTIGDGVDATKAQDGGRGGGDATRAAEPVTPRAEPATPHHLSLQMPPPQQSPHVISLGLGEAEGPSGRRRRSSLRR